ncbi:MAG: hypothetical protein QXE52_08295 [Candidatus Caldarchaeum sp.]
MAEEVILDRIKTLMREHDFLSLRTPAEDWAALLCLMYWERYQGLRWAKTNPLRKLTSPETLLRLARKHDLTPNKEMQKPDIGEGQENLDNYK